MTRMTMIVSQSAVIQIPATGRSGQRSLISVIEIEAQDREGNGGIEKREESGVMNPTVCVLTSFECYNSELGGDGDIE